MSEKRAPLAPTRKQSEESRQDRSRQERPGRSGEGARSVLPHLRADRKARAVAKIGREEATGF